MTLSANALDHFLQKAGRMVDPTVRDLLLVAVATLPPLVVERLLNLQSLLVGDLGRGVSEPRGSLTREPEELGEEALAQNPTIEIVGESHSSVQPGRESMAARRVNWTVHGHEVFVGLGDSLGRRPSGREFQAALAAHARKLIADGLLPAGTRPPSVTSAKRIRAAIEGAQSNPGVRI